MDVFLADARKFGVHLVDVALFLDIDLDGGHINGAAEVDRPHEERSRQAWTSYARALMAANEFVYLD